MGNGPCINVPVTDGLVGHFSARVGTSITKDNAGKVTAWNDLSGKNHTLSSADGPIWKADAMGTLPGIDFGNGRRMLTEAFDLKKQVTVFVVLKYGTPGDWGAIIQHGSHDADWGLRANNTKPGSVSFITSNDNDSTDIPLTTATNYVLAARMGTKRTFAAIGAGATVTVNGAGSTTITEGAKQLSVGASDNEEPSNAVIGEVVYYARALDNLERAQVLSWLEKAWSIAPCDEGKQDNDLNATCSADCSTAALTTCNANGPCSDVTGTAVCTCRSGFAGDGTTCKACDVCSVHGKCDEGPTGTAACVCGKGYSGADCTGCAENYEPGAGGVCRTGRSIILPGTANQSVNGIFEDATSLYFSGMTNGDQSTFFGSTENLGDQDVGFIMGLDPATANRKWAVRTYTPARISVSQSTMDPAGNIILAGWSYSPTISFALLNDPAAGGGPTQVVDTFEAGPVIVSGAGNPVYSFFGGAGPVGGRRELYVRDGHSNPSANITIDATKGQAELWGNVSAPDQRILWGTAIGSVYPGFGDRSPNSGVELNLVRKLSDALEVDLASIPAGQVSLNITLKTGSGDFGASVYPVPSSGTQRFPLSRFTGMTEGAAGDIDGIILSSNVNAAQGAGLVIDEIRFGPPQATNKLANASGAWAASFTKAGVYRWSKAFAGEGYGVATDTIGNVYLSGLGNGTNFGGGDIPGIGGTDAHLSSFTNDGVCRWGKVLGGTPAGGAVPGDQFNDVTTDADDNVYVTGQMAVKANFGGADLTCTGTDACLLVASYTSEGEHRWSKSFPRAGAAGWSWGRRIAVKDGVVVVAAYFSGAHDFGGGEVVQEPDFANVSGTVLLTMGASNGAVVKQRAFLAGLPISVEDLKFDANGDLHIVGNKNNGGGTLGGDPTPGGGAYRAVYGPDLSFKSAKIAGGGAYPIASRIIPRADGTEVVAGVTGTTIDWGYGVLTNSSLYNDIWLTWFP